MADQVALQFDAQGAAVEQPPLQSQAHQGLWPGLATEDEGFAEGRVGHLAAPGGGGPGVGLPVGQVGNGRGAGHRLAGPQGLGGRLVDVEVLGAGVQIQNAVDVLDLAHPFQQAVAQPTGLQILLTALEAHATGGVDGARVEVVFDPLRPQLAARQGGGSVAGGHHPAQLGVIALLVGRQANLQRYSRYGTGRI